MPDTATPAPSDLPPLLDGDCPRYREHGLVCVRGKHHAGDCGAQSVLAVTRPCRSNVHTWPVQATVVGTFDCSNLNGKEPEPDSAYCLRCAVLLHESVLFTPTDGTVLPDVEAFLADHGVDLP